MGNPEKDKQTGRWGRIFRRKADPNNQLISETMKYLDESPFALRNKIIDEKLKIIDDFMSEPQPIGKTHYLLKNSELKSFDPEDRDKIIAGIYKRFKARVPLEIIDSDPDLQAKFADIRERTRLIGGEIADGTRIAFVQTITQISDRAALVRETGFTWKNKNQVIAGKRNTYSIMATDPRKENVPVGETINVYSL